ncbi:hypothetical protein O9993_08355 [Vibrio lentus]|nr:hypothetical protein [Vibrio lentus]
MGQLKALDELGLLPRVKYISAVSGGGWAATPFTYTKDTGSVLPAGYAILESITFSNSKSVHPRSMQSAITDSLVSKLVAGGLKLKGDESFAYSLGKVFLKTSYGLHDPSHRYFISIKRPEALARQGFPLMLKWIFIRHAKGQAPLSYSLRRLY